MFILKEFCDREILLCNFLLHYLNSTPPSRVTRQNFLAMFTSVKSTERWVIGWWKLSMMVFAVLTLYRNVTDRRVSGFATCVASYAVARWKSWIWYIVDRFLTDAMNHRHAKKTFLHALMSQTTISTQSLRHGVRNLLIYVDWYGSCKK